MLGIESRVDELKKGCVIHKSMWYQSNISAIRDSRNYISLVHLLHTVKTRVLVESPQLLSPEVERDCHDNRKHGEGKLDHVDGDPALRLRNVEDPVAERETELDKPR